MDFSSRDRSERMLVIRFGRYVMCWVGRTSFWCITRENTGRFGSQLGSSIEAECPACQTLREGVSQGDGQSQPADDGIFNPDAARQLAGQMLLRQADDQIEGDHG